MNGRDTLGARLRAKRERAGITLEAIAASTKINRSLLLGLENNDVSHWPGGIYRRAFFRSYLAEIGLQSEALVAEFVEMFPDSRRVPGPDPSNSFSGAEGGLRLKLADTKFADGRRFGWQLAAAASDLFAVFALTAAAVLLFQLQLWPVAAGISLTYCFVSVVCLGRTPGAQLVSMRHQPARRRGPVQVVLEPRPLRLVVRRSDPSRSHASDAETSVA